MFDAERRRHRSGQARQTGRGLPILAALLISVSACGGANPDEPGEIPTVDVPPSLTVDVEQDPRAARAAPKLTGVLPEDFPADLPLRLPASLVDFGVAGDGSRFVSLLSPGSPARVGAEIERSLRDGGWTPAGGSAPGRWQKDGRRIRLRIEDAKPGAYYRFDY